MNLEITKSARQFGYVIWNGKQENRVRALIGDVESIDISFNGIYIGQKKVDWKYHRISIGYKFTRGLPASANTYLLKFENNILEVWVNG